MTLESYLLYLGVLGAFFATPPDTSQLLVMSNSLRHGLRRSLATVAGDLTANSMQMTAAAFGLTAVLAVSSDAIWWIKWLGVGYLSWIGLRLMMARQSPERPKAAAPGRLFRMGFLTSMSNPYAVVFFGALFPQFLDPSAAIWPQLLILGLSYLLVDGLILVLWGWLAVSSIGRLKGVGTPVLNRISGGLMVAAAALLASRDLAGAQR
ncbi:MAG: LysE family translocator [Pseudomonadota bacterium]